MPDNITETSNNSPLGDGGRHNMFYGANPILFELAEELRAKMTPAEEIFWNAIKINEWHLKFRRQHPISTYIADFYCHQVKLVIELDGGYHENKEVKIYDAAREKDIKEYGITVLRFKNEEIFNDLSNVLDKINLAISKLKNVAREIVKSSNNSPLGDGGKLFVIKIGGNVIDDEKNLSTFFKNFAAIPGLKILIHGGGKIATKIGDKLGITSKYIEGRRITDADTIDLVTMVYGGLINKKIVAQLQSLNCNAIGLTGADANLIPATKRPVIYKKAQDKVESLNNSPLGDGGIDFGFAGDINSSQLAVGSLQILIDNNLTPVIAPLTHDGKGQMLNTNADTIASSIAVALSKLYDVRLIYCFEKKGVLENVNDENSAIPLITKEIYQQLKNGNKLFDGILPKIDNAFAAIDSGVKEVLIGHANDVLQNVTDQTTGTLIK
jgi:acetylglutamate kinase